ncbi:MAG: pitrilysin family protein [Pseudomonadota bacterium]
MSVSLHRLPNGVRVVTEEMPGLHSASVGVWVTAGGRHERARENGIAHFLEHMAFKGTQRRSAFDIAEEIENVGGYINAYTSREMTAYYARVLENDVDLALDVISDIVLNPAFDPKEIEVERHVILQEIGQALDTPDDIIFDWLQEAAYPDQPMGRTILGPAERIEAFGRDDLAGFVADHYQPGSIIVAAAGAIDPEAVLKRVEATFGAMPAGTLAQPKPAAFRGGEHRVVKDLEQAHVAFGFEMPGYRDDAIYAAQIFTTAFGGGMSSRLFQEVREKRGLCYTIFAQAGAYADSGMMTIYAGTSGEEVAELTELTCDELARAADGLREDELDRARAQIKAGLLMGLESPSNRAERLARMVAIWDRVPDVTETIERIDGVTGADVRALAGKMVETQAALALYGQVSGAPELLALRRRLAA